MRVGIGILLCLILISSSGVCEQLPFETTGDQWVAMGSEEKSQYLAVLYDSVVVESEAIPKSVDADTMEAGHPFIVDKQAASQRLDELYSDEANRSIPVMTALVFLKAQDDGAGEEELQAIVEEMNAEIERIKQEFAKKANE